MIPEELLERNLENLIKRMDHPEFDCKRCGKHYVSAEGQLIFYDLCDECFKRFDRQKMWGRVRSMPEGSESFAKVRIFVINQWEIDPKAIPEKTFEDAEEWIPYDKEQEASHEQDK